jgi:hypothetical protein
MINLEFSIRNPWISRWDSGVCWSGNLLKHKFWELQFMKTADIINFKFSITHRQDHAGLIFEIGLAGYTANFTIYDNRHWDTEKFRWHD